MHLEIIKLKQVGIAVFKQRSATTILKDMSFDEVYRFCCTAEAPYVELLSGASDWSIRRANTIRVRDLFNPSFTSSFQVVLDENRTGQRQQVRQILSALFLRHQDSVSFVNDLHSFYLHGGADAYRLVGKQSSSFPIDVAVWARLGRNSGLEGKDDVEVALKGYNAATPEWLDYYARFYHRLYRAYALAELETVLVDGANKRVLYEIDKQVTGRTSSVCPDKNVYWNPGMSRSKRMFVVPRPGCAFIYADYTAAEVITLAYESEDTQLLDFVSGKMPIDLYTAISTWAWNRDDVQARLSAKQAFLAFIYGGSNPAIAKLAKISYAEVDALITATIEMFPTAHEWMLMIREAAEGCGTITTRFGRQIKLDAAYKAVNYFLQSETSDWNKVSFVVAQEMLNDVFHGTARGIVHQHDGFLFQVPKNTVDYACGVMRQVLVQGVCSELEKFGFTRFKPMVKIEKRLTAWEEPA